MSKTIVSFASAYSNSAGFRFLCVKGSSAVEIHRKLCLVHRPTVMSDEKVRQWYRGFKKRPHKVYEEGWNGRLTIQTDDIFE